MSSADVIRRYFVPAANVLALLGLAVFACWPIPAVDPLNPSISRLLVWLIRIDDIRWATGPFMGCVWLVAVFGYWKWRAPLVRLRQGHALWLAGFLILLVALVLGIRVQARAFSMSLMAPLLTCGAGWVLGGAVLRRFWFGAVLLWIFLLPSPWLVDQYDAGQSHAQSWLERRIGWREVWDWEAVMNRSFPWMPHPVHTVFLSLVACWLMPGGLWWWVRALLLIMGFSFAAADFLLHRGC